MKKQDRNSPLPPRDSLKLVVFDLDGTLTDCLSIWQQIHERLGIWDDGASVHQAQFLRGEIDYAEFARLDAGHWTGITRERLEEIVGEVGFHPEAAECLGRLRQELGLKIAVISSGLTLMTDRARRELGVDYAFANRLVLRDRVVTGEVDVVVPIGGKGAVMERLMGRLRVQPREAVAVGDSADDLDLFQRAGLRIAVNPRHDELRQAAHAVCTSDDFLGVYRAVSEASRAAGQASPTAGD